MIGDFGHKYKGFHIPKVNHEKIDIENQLIINNNSSQLENQK